MKCGRLLHPIKQTRNIGKGQGNELLGYFLPEGTLEYFDITHFAKDKEGLVLFLEEKNLPPTEYAGQTLHSKGFYPEVRVQDFPIRENKVELSIKRRRWEVQTSGEIVSRNWDVVMKGARLTKEFALFLKDTLGHHPINCHQLARMYQMDGSQLQQQYKHHISDYKNWDQRELPTNQPKVKKGFSGDDQRHLGRQGY